MTKELTTMDLRVGQHVHYQPAHYGEDEFENGIIKEIRPDVRDAVWVVFNCAGEWAHYQEYTAAKTNLRDLKDGWRVKPDDNS